MPTSIDEPRDQLWLEQSINTAGYLGTIAYGLHIAVYSAATYYLLASRTPRRWRFHAFNTIIFAMGTIHIATTIRFDQQAWILERNYPGGPSAFLLHEESRPLVLLGISAAAIAGFMVDGLLVGHLLRVHRRHRCAHTPNRFLKPSQPESSFFTPVLTIANIIESAHPYTGTWGPNLGIACWATSMALNMLLTTLLAAKILHHRRKLLANGLANASSTYLGAVSMLIETAFPVGLISCIFIILYARQNTAENLFTPLISQVYCIAPQLIIIRVYRGHAWSADTVTRAQGSPGHSPQESRITSPEELPNIQFAQRSSRQPHKFETSSIITSTEDPGSAGILKKEGFDRHETRAEKSPV
ncbi:hypothetical protein PC9H_008250 [Pleurotus ostreatus]|uniref:Uncharacterized protein n=1 Tax=Pleurotus ostreatus TaxID=5322 RepID=A0A8H6ZZS7_PLEOS|nr:uncharacterized protein PC9H_008250 [Pleurotus ostreatus]KAF7429012.1 hypothetical protein PC9H_008250 [Pleurotus ostreatus]